MRIFDFEVFMMICHSVTVIHKSNLIQKVYKNIAYGIALISIIALSGLTPSNLAGQEIDQTKILTHLEEILKTDTSDYRLGAGDVVSITVEFVPEISKIYTISDTGSITFSTLLQTLKVQGLNVEQLHVLLVKALKEYMYEPQVTVSIIEYNSHKVLLLGSFQKPGNHILKKEKVPLLDILTEAGGLREVKDEDELIILRNPSLPVLAASISENSELSDTMQCTRINLQKLLRDGDLTQNIMIEAGDVIYVSSFFAVEQYVYVAGGGRRGTGVIPYEQGLTAFKALMRAGIAPEDPQSLDLIIIRGQSDSEEYITTQLNFDPMNPGVKDIALKPEDIIILPSANSQVIYTAGEVNKPGTTPYKEGQTVLQAVLDAGGMSKKAIGTKVKILRDDPLGRTQIPVDMNSILENGDKKQNITLIPGDIILVPGMTLQSDIMVTGKVNNPGLIPYEEGITLVRAILLSGGLGNNALKSEIRIMKKSGEIQPAFSFNISKAQSGEVVDYNPILEQGDLVVVLGASTGNIVSILGKVQRPGIIEYEDGLTVLQAILRSGGFNQGAARSKVRIVRGEGNKQQNLSADLENLTDKNNRSREIPLLPGDIVIVPETFF
jgi:protein involved in polysaccharide export with SLBB domain